jgi:hypothetical protein
MASITGASLTGSRSSLLRPERAISGGLQALDVGRRQPAEVLTQVADGLFADLVLPGYLGDRGAISSSVWRLFLIGSSLTKGHRSGNHWSEETGQVGRALLSKHISTSALQEF